MQTNYSPRTVEINAPAKAGIDEEQYSRVCLVIMTQLVVVQKQERTELYVRQTRQHMFTREKEHPNEIRWITEARSKGM